MKAKLIIQSPAKGTPRGVKYVVQTVDPMNVRSIVTKLLQTHAQVLVLWDGATYACIPDVECGYMRLKVEAHPWLQEVKVSK